MKRQNSKSNKIEREFHNKKSNKFQDFNFEFKLRIFIESCESIEICRKKQVDEETEVKSG